MIKNEQKKNKGIMGFFNKILVQETKTGNIVDITNLDKKDYESFLEAMQLLQASYIKALNKKDKSRVFIRPHLALGKGYYKG